MLQNSKAIVVNGSEEFLSTISYATRLADVQNVQLSELTQPDVAEKIFENLAVLIFESPPTVEKLTKVLKTRPKNWRPNAYIIVPAQNSDEIASVVEAFGYLALHKIETDEGVGITLFERAPPKINVQQACADLPMSPLKEAQRTFSTASCVVSIPIRKRAKLESFTIVSDLHKSWAEQRFRSFEGDQRATDPVVVMHNPVVFDARAVFSPDASKLYEDISDPMKARALRFETSNLHISNQAASPLSGAYMLAPLSDYPHSDWLARGLCRVHLAQLVEPNVKILAPERLSRFRKIMLYYCGFDESKIIKSPPNSIVCPERLIAPVQRPFRQIDDHVYDFYQKLRENVLSNYSPVSTSTLPKRFFIQRRDRPNENMRQLLNEAEVIACVNEFKLETIFLEDISFEDEVKLFYDAELIVGELGAGLYNSMFSKPETKIISLASVSYLHSTPMPHIASIFGLDLDILVGEDIHFDDPSYRGIASSWVAPVSHLRKALDQDSLSPRSSSSEKRPLRQSAADGTIKLGVAVPVSAGSAGECFLTSGFRSPESWGVWAVGQTCLVSIPLPMGGKAQNRNLTVTIRCRYNLATHASRAEVRVRRSGDPASKSLVFTDSEWSHQVLEFATHDDDFLELILDYQNEKGDLTFAVASFRVDVRE